jgi:sterol 3beta-glucosyltransferase
MKVLILTNGTRGDVQPFVALARGLRAADHKVVFGVPDGLASIAEPHSDRIIRFADFRQGREDPTYRKTMESGSRGPLGAISTVQWIRHHRAMMAPVFDDLASVADEDADVIVHHSMLPAHEVAERMGVPAVPVCIGPFWVPTASFGNPAVPFRVPRWFNRASYQWTHVMRRMMTGGTRTWRQRTLGLPPRRGHHNVLRRPDGTPAVVLQAFSRHLLPEPLGYPESVHTTGFWFLPAEQGWSPPSRLAEFLAMGDTPVCIGFGSVIGTDPQRTGRIIVEAVRRANVRAVVVAGWGGIRLSELPASLLLVDQAPSDWLFPRVAAIVHAAGAGTSGAALASGRPQVVCPFSNAGQPYWAERMHASGVSPAPVPQHRLSAEELAGAIRRAVTDHGMAMKAEHLGRRIREEDGVSAAVEVLESVVG